MKSFTQIEGKSGILSLGLYKMYKKHFKGPDRKCQANVPYVDWLRICKKFNQRIMNSIIEGYIFKMPFHLGSIGIVEMKPRLKFKEDGTLNTDNLGVDWEKTLNLWKELYPEVKLRKEYKEIRNKPMVFYTNEHTDGRIVKFRWKKKGTNLINKSVYAFEVADRYKKELSNLLSYNPNKQYCVKF